MQQLMASPSGQRAMRNLSGASLAALNGAQSKDSNPAG